MSTFNNIKQTIYNYPGFRTKRKLLVFESDDWGALRTPTKDKRQALIESGMDLETNPYHRFDSLERNEDISQLMEVLSSVVDKKGNCAVFTLNNSTANPNFESIRESDYKQYYFEPFTKTYQRFPESDQVKELIDKGRSFGVFNVQFHGREHLNIPRWMKELMNGNKQVRKAFNYEMYSPPVATAMNYPMEFMDALDYDSEQEASEKVSIVKAGLNIFKSVWGTYPESFIAPCYRWDSKIEKMLSSEGVNVIQSQRAQLIPQPYPGNTVKTAFRYTGQRNKFGQVYTVRNVIFEPSLMNHDDSVVTNAIQQIKLSFNMKKPAIISSHRINYIGRLDSWNSEKSNELLEKLLKRITKLYPDVEFVHSAQLGNIILEA